MRWISKYGLAAASAPPPANKPPPGVIPPAPEVSVAAGVSFERDGVHVLSVCPRHKGPKEITIEWNEVAEIAQNASPHKRFPGQTEWRLMPLGWCPMGIVCTGCDASLSIYVTRAQAREYLRIGVREGYVSSVSPQNPLGLDNDPLGSIGPISMVDDP